MPGPVGRGDRELEEGAMFYTRAAPPTPVSASVHNGLQEWGGYLAPF